MGLELEGGEFKLEFLRGIPVGGEICKPDLFFFGVEVLPLIKDEGGTIQHHVLPHNFI